MLFEWKPSFPIDSDLNPYEIDFWNNEPAEEYLNDILPWDEENQDILPKPINEEEEFGAHKVTEDEDANASDVDEPYDSDDGDILVESNSENDGDPDNDLESESESENKNGYES